MTAIAQAPPAPASAPRTYTIGHGALLHALERTTVRVVVPAVGTVHLPPVEDLAWFGGIAVLVAAGVMEWPVAVAIGAGHLLAHQTHLRLVRTFAEALEEA